MIVPADWLALEIVTNLSCIGSVTLGYVWVDESLSIAQVNAKESVLILTASPIFNPWLAPIVRTKLPFDGM